MFNWRDFLCELLGCKSDCREYLDKLTQCQQLTKEQGLKIAEQDEIIRQLELLVPRPTPPELDYLVERDTAWIQQILVKTGLEIIRLPLGIEFRLTDKDTFLEFIAWSWVDSFDYHKFYRCGNFSIAFKADGDRWGVNQVGIVLDYKSSHAYNIVVFPDGKVMLLEPQRDSLFYIDERQPEFYNLEGAFVII